MAERVGTGARYRGLEAKLAGKHGVNNPSALAAAIGRKKYGAKRMAQLAAAGRRRKNPEGQTQPDPKPPVRRRIRV